MSEFKLTTVEEFEASTERLLETGCLLYTSGKHCDEWSDCAV